MESPVALGFAISAFQAARTSGLAFASGFVVSVFQAGAIMNNPIKPGKCPFTTANVTD